MLPSFCQDEVIVVRPATRQSRGTVVEDWSNATTHVEDGCSVQLPSTSMDLDGRRQTSLTAMLFAPPFADIRAGDRIRWSPPMGFLHEFVVDGEPMPWTSPTGRVSHVQANLVEWKG